MQSTTLVRSMIARAFVLTEPASDPHGAYNWAGVVVFHTTESASRSRRHDCIVVLLRTLVLLACICELLRYFLFFVIFLHSGRPREASIKREHRPLFLWHGYRRTLPGKMPKIVLRLVHCAVLCTECRVRLGYESIVRVVGSCGKGVKDRRNNTVQYRLIFFHTVFCLLF